MNATNRRTSTRAFPCTARIGAIARSCGESPNIAGANLSATMRFTYVNTIKKSPDTATNITLVRSTDQNTSPRPCESCQSKFMYQPDKLLANTNSNNRARTIPIRTIRPLPGRPTFNWGRRGPRVPRGGRSEGLRTCANLVLLGGVLGSTPKCHAAQIFS